MGEHIERLRLDKPLYVKGHCDRFPGQPAADFAMTEEVREQVEDKRLTFLGGPSAATTLSSCPSHERFGRGTGRFIKREAMDWA